MTSAVRGVLTARHLNLANAASIAVLGGLIGLVVATGSRLFHTYFGDPTIYLIYARNAAHGDFFSFNPNQFSSGTTSILWLFVLSVPYVVGAGLIGVKVLCITVTVFSVVAVAYTAQRIVGSWLAASLGTAFTASAVGYWGGLGYDSPLTLIIIAASVLVAHDAASAPSITRPIWVRLAVVWALLPLARPDAAIIAVFEVLALLAVTRSRRGIAIPLLFAIGVASIPSLAYYGYSVVTLGTYSVSSDARSYALAVTASHWHGIRYSSQSIAYLDSVKTPLAAAAVGLLVLLCRRSTRVVAAVGLATLVAYPLLVVFVTPVTFYMERYLLPMAPFVAVGLASIFVEAWRRLVRIDPDGVRVRIEWWRLILHLTYPRLG